MFQQWGELLFLHWEIDPTGTQALLAQLDEVVFEKRFPMNLDHGLGANIRERTQSFATASGQATAKATTGQHPMHPPIRCARLMFR